MTYKTLAEIIRDSIFERLKIHRGNVTKTAESLNVARSTVTRNLTKEEVNKTRNLRVLRESEGGVWGTKKP